MSEPALILLAAGRATRYGGLKPLAPVGPNGEAVIDLLASDAYCGGFTHIVVVVGPTTGASIRYHIERCWPETLRVTYALQEVPRGTVDALNVGMDLTATDAPVGVANADDVYGADALGALYRHLQKEGDDHLLVTYKLGQTLLSNDPVTRGVCEPDKNGHLARIVERRKVARTPDGEIAAHDGLSPTILPETAPVSVNLWGFRPHFRPLVKEAMANASGEGEVLLPELVDDHLPHGTNSLSVTLFGAGGPCIGVTHGSDLPLAQQAIARLVSQGDRPARLFAGKAER